MDKFHGNPTNYPLLTDSWIIRSPKTRLRNGLGNTDPRPLAQPMSVPMLQPGPRYIRRTPQQSPRRSSARCTCNCKSGPDRILLRESPFSVLTATAFGHPLRHRFAPTTCRRLLLGRSHGRRRRWGGDPKPHLLHVQPTASPRDAVPLSCPLQAIGTAGRSGTSPRRRRKRPWWTRAPSSTTLMTTTTTPTTVLTAGLIPPKSTGSPTNLCGFCGTTYWWGIWLVFLFLCSGYGGEEEGFHEARVEGGSREPSALGVRRRPHLPRDLLAALQTGLRFPHRHRGACVQVPFHTQILPAFGLRLLMFVSGLYTTQPEFQQLISA